MCVCEDVIILVADSCVIDQVNEECLVFIFLQREREREREREAYDLIYKVTMTVMKRKNL